MATSARLSLLPPDVSDDTVRLSSDLVLGFGEGIEAAHAEFETQVPSTLEPLLDQLEGVQLSVPVGVPVTVNVHEPICGCVLN